MNRKDKQGNVFLCLGVLVLIIIFSATFFVYYQVTVITHNVREDLFYASSNAVLSLDVGELSYRQYTVDENKTKQVIEYLLNKNYIQDDGSISKIQITNLEVECGQNKLHLNVEVKITFKSVINLIGKNEHSFKMNENIKIALMDYQTGEVYE